MARSFFSLYLEHGMRPHALLPSGFGDEEARRQVVATAARRPLAPALHAELVRQQERLPRSAARTRALGALARPGTVAVLTGQQVGLFGGPLYSAYKAATAIVLARRLEAESGVRAVPIFWLATDDHDLAEIDHCFIAPGDAAAPVRLQVSAKGRQDARQPVAAAQLGDDIDRALDAASAALRGRPEAAEVVTLLGAHYRPGGRFGDAFAGLLASLFADEELLFFDPRTEAVAALAAPTYLTALLGAETIGRRLTERSGQLGLLGVEAQVHLRPEATLLFRHQGGPDGARQLVGQVDAETLATLERDPLSFSASALLRPIVQDALFPTAAYVGGPAEVSYLAQSAALYDLFDLPVPLVAPRARFRLVDARSQARLERLGLTAAEIEQPREKLLAALGQARAQPLLEPLWGELARSRAALGRLAAPLGALDAELARALRRTEATVTRAIERLGARYRRALVQKDTELAAALERLGGRLYPAGAPQERVFAFASFAADVGCAPFIRRLLAAVDPFDPAVVDLEWPA